jgi:hypothetical protein
MNNSRIPMLKRNASAQDIVNYLNWLSESDFCYHIDDCPMDIQFETEVSEEHIALLKWNSDIMWNHQCEDINGFLWTNFNPSWNNFEYECFMPISIPVEEIIEEEEIKRNLKDLKDWISAEEFTERELDMPFELINRRTQVYPVSEAEILIEYYLTSHDECVLENSEDFSSIEIYTAQAKENRFERARQIISEIKSKI